MPLATIQFVLLYHTLHDMGGVHTEVCVFILVGIYVMIVWNGDRNARTDIKPSQPIGEYLKLNKGN